MKKLTDHGQSGPTSRYTYDSSSKHTQASVLLHSIMAYFMVYCVFSIGRAYDIYSYDDHITGSGPGLLQAWTSRYPSDKLKQLQVSLSTRRTTHCLDSCLHWRVRTLGEHFKKFHIEQYHFASTFHTYWYLITLLCCFGKINFLCVTSCFL